LLIDVAEVFRRDSPPLLAEMRMAVQRGDCESLERAAHRLKGSSGIFCAYATAEAAKRLEAIGRSRDLTEADEALTLLEAEMTRLLPAMDALAEQLKLSKS
jgi:HPt (histidine-containing phosphotransfer) domain-containing protein